MGLAVRRQKSTYAFGRAAGQGVPGESGDWLRVQGVGIRDSSWRGKVLYEGQAPIMSAPREGALEEAESQAAGTIRSRSIRSKRLESCAETSSIERFRLSFAYRAAVSRLSLGIAYGFGLPTTCPVFVKMRYSPPPRHDCHDCHAHHIRALRRTTSLVSSGMKYLEVRGELSRSTRTGKWLANIHRM